MFASQMPSRRFLSARRSTIACLSIVLVIAPCWRLGAQAVADAASAEWRAWAFGRLGAARTPQINLAALSAGVAASYGAILGMVRVTDNDQVSFEGPSAAVQDLSLLAGARTRGDHVFLAGALGIARATPFNVFKADGTRATQEFAPAFDLSAHADYRVAGLSLTVSGVAGSASTRYVAISLGAELGWFGF